MLDLNDEFVHMSDLSPSPLHRGGGYGDRFPGSSFDEEQQPNQRFETSFGGPPDPTVGDSGFNPDTGERPCDAGIDSGGSTDRHCCQYRTQMKYILRELQCLSNKVQGDDKKDAIKKCVLLLSLYGYTQCIRSRLRGIEARICKIFSYLFCKIFQ